MTRRLPPFAALRAFEAVARHLSFTRAAEDLGITQAAVSRQVRALEQELKVPLVHRHATHNTLSAQGRSLYETLRESLDRMEDAVRAASSRPGQAILTVSVAPFFSSVWLTPRIMKFIKAHPAIDLRLHHSYDPPDYRREQIDMGINWGNGRWSRVKAERVLDGALTPLCAPGYLETGKRVRPRDLLDRNLFYEFRLSDWRVWFAKAGLDLADDPPATRIDDSSALLRIALEGHGIALFFPSLAHDDLSIGRLVQPFDQTVDTGRHYFLNYPDSREMTAAAKAFRRWLLAELHQP